jgi:hypothetical protein
VVSWLAAYLKQTLTYWEEIGLDGYGKQVFATPVQIPGRWEERAEYFINPAGQSEPSKAVAYLDRDVKIGDYLMLGSSAVANPQAVGSAHRVFDFRKIPGIMAEDYERRVLM